MNEINCRPSIVYITTKNIERMQYIHKAHSHLRRSLVLALFMSCCPHYHDVHYINYRTVTWPQEQVEGHMARTKELAVCYGGLWHNVTAQCQVQVYHSLDWRMSPQFILSAVLAFGASKSQVGVAEFPIPLPTDTPPITPIPTIHNISKGAVLAVDFHPQKRCACLLAMEHVRRFYHGSVQFQNLPCPHKEKS